MNRRQFVQSLIAAASLPSGPGAVGFGSGGKGAPQAGAWPDPVLWYSRSAVKWVEALPVGNGHLGAMVFGDVGCERLQVNDDTLWSGGPGRWDAPQARQVLLDVRRLTLEGNVTEADRLAHGLMGCYTQSYLPLGDLWLTFEHGNIGRDYRRALRLDDAIASVRYKVGGVQYTREVIASAVAGVIVLRLTADKPGMIACSARLSSPLNHVVASQGTVLRLTGTAPAHVDPSYYDTDVPVQYGRAGGTPSGSFTPGQTPVPGSGRRTLPGMAFELGLTAVTDGGTVSAHDTTLRVAQADAVTFVVATATGFNGFEKDPAVDGRDPAPLVAQRLAAAVARSWTELRAEHVADHQALFRRFTLDLGSVKAGTADVPTDRRIASRGASDAGLVELLLQYGRYLLIASSRPGTQPANLQGIWNDEVRAPWSANYTININAQMNYWPAETAALPEMHEPLLDFIGELAVNGRRTASSMYGTRGWTAHHNSDLWRQSGMVGDWGHGAPVWACWQMGGPWLAQHLYERYLFGGDLAYLRDKAYPVLRGAAEFCLDWLVEDGAGHLVTAPSTSPENRFRLASGREAAISAGATMDMALMRDTFAHTADAAEALGIDRDFRRQVLEARARLRPYRIGSKGQLLEWAEEFGEPEPNHRHISHLYGLHPGRHITPATPALFHGVRRSLELRGDAGTGWSLAWKVNQWARLLDGDHAFRVLSGLLTLVDTTDTNYRGGGGVYANLFDAHPPFQIDGNFGVTAGIIEMFAQSHAGEIHLLPALPAAWPNGRVRGIRLRGGFDVDLEWSGGSLARAELRSRLGGVARIRTPHAMQITGGPTRPSSGPNPNPFYRLHDPGPPTVAPGVAIPLTPRAGVLVDVTTERGMTVVLSA